VQLILTLDTIFFASLMISFVGSLTPNTSLQNVKFSMVKSPEPTEMKETEKLLHIQVL
jgi:hypothetical protein